MDPENPWPSLEVLDVLGGGVDGTPGSVAAVPALGCVGCPEHATCSGGRAAPVPKEGYLLGPDSQLTECTTLGCVDGGCRGGYMGYLCQCAFPAPDRSLSFFWGTLPCLRPQATLMVKPVD